MQRAAPATRSSRLCRCSANTTSPRPSRLDGARGSLSADGVGSSSGSRGASAGGSRVAARRQHAGRPGPAALFSHAGASRWLAHQRASPLGQLPRRRKLRLVVQAARSHAEAQPASPVTQPRPHAGADSDAAQARRTNVAPCQRERGTGSRRAGRRRRSVGNRRWPRPICSALTALEAGTAAAQRSTAGRTRSRRAERSTHASTLISAATLGQRGASASSRSSGACNALGRRAAQISTFAPSSTTRLVGRLQEVGRRAALRCMLRTASRATSPCRRRRSG